MSYDDGRTQDRRLVALFNRFGIRGTFHLNSGFLGDERHIRPDRECVTSKVCHHI
jgi:hypothetical protein